MEESKHESKSNGALIHIYEVVIAIDPSVHWWLSVCVCHVMEDAGREENLATPATLPTRARLHFYLHRPLACFTVVVSWHEIRHVHQ